MPFWTRLRDLLQLEDAIFSKRDDRRFWSEIRELIAARIATKTREEWTALLEPTDVCYAPVLTMDEAPQHPHNKAREIFQTVNGIVHPAPAPRFGEGIPQAAAIDMTPVAAEEILREWE
jgi:alpha-methylacyl-CoA racemase